MIAAWRRMFGPTNGSTIEVLPTANGDGSWFAHLKGPNGEIEWSTQTYTRKADAIRGAKDAQRNTAQARIIIEQG